MAKVLKATKAPALDARVVLAHVRGGRVPPFWQMNRWRRRRDLARLATSVAALALVVLLVAAITLIADMFDPQELVELRLIASGSVDALDVVLAAGALVVSAAAMLLLAVALQACIALLLPRGSRPMLVLLPEGCVERTGALARRVRVVSFGEISHIELRVSKIRMAASNGMSRFPVVTTRSSIRLVLHYWTGRTRTWVLRDSFGQPAALAQAIIAAHGEYANNVSARRPRVSRPDERAS